MFNLLAVANMSEKYLRIYGGGGTPPFGVPRTPLPLGVPRKPSTRLIDENFYTKTPKIILILLAKNLSRILKNEVRNQKISRKGECAPTLKMGKM